ncbi:MAG TPA: prepilin-type N-terminal cleavage/methylation domain-containing protein [Verrucomicrobiae bacterium]
MRRAQSWRFRGLAGPGFSLIELLLVVAILLLLVTLYWSPNSGSRQRALQVACQRNLQKLSIGLQIYATDNGGRYPFLSNAVRSEQALGLLVPRYNSDNSLFICAGSKDPAPAAGRSLSDSRISYAYYMGRASTSLGTVVMTDAQVNTESKSAGELVFSPDGKPPANNHEKAGGNLLFSDGHTQAFPPRASLPLPVGAGERLLNP